MSNHELASQERGGRLEVDIVVIEQMIKERRALRVAALSKAVEIKTELEELEIERRNLRFQQEAQNLRDIERTFDNRIDWVYTFGGYTRHTCYRRRFGCVLSQRGKQ